MREEQEQRDKTNVHALLRFVLFHPRKASSYARRVKNFVSTRNSTQHGSWYYARTTTSASRAQKIAKIDPPKDLQLLKLKPCCITSVYYLYVLYSGIVTLCLVSNELIYLFYRSWVCFQTKVHPTIQNSFWDYLLLTFAYQHLGIFSWNSATFCCCQIVKFKFFHIFLRG